ncbi:unnamed protein product, partial [Allacma fusca]
MPPFFASSRSLIQQNAIPEKPALTSDEQRDSDSWTEPDQQSGESPKLNVRSPGMSPSFSMATTSSVVPSSLPLTTPSRIVNDTLGLYSKSKPGSISDQVAKALPADEGFPDLVVLVSLESTLGPGIFVTLADRGVKVLGIESEADLRVAFPHIVGKVQKFCNNNAKAPSPLTVVAIGNEAFLNAITKHFVTQLSSRPHDWQSYFSFLYSPFTTGGSVWKLLCHKDPEYGQTFNDFKQNVARQMKWLCVFSPMLKWQWSVDS